MIKISDLNRHDLNQPILLMGSLMINSLHNHRWVQEWKFLKISQYLPKLWAI